MSHEHLKEFELYVDAMPKDQLAIAFKALAMLAGKLDRLPNLDYVMRELYPSEAETVLIWVHRWIEANQRPIACDLSTQQQALMGRICPECE